MYEFLLSQHADVFRLPEATQPMQMRCRQALGTFWRGIFPFCRERGRSWMKYSKLNIKNLINGSSLADSPADICPAAERSEGQKQKRRASDQGRINGKLCRGCVLSESSPKPSFLRRCSISLPCFIHLLLFYFKSRKISNLQCNKISACFVCVQHNYISSPLHTTPGITQQGFSFSCLHRVPLFQNFKIKSFTLHPVFG